MDARYIRYNKKEFERIITYYLGTPKIYNYCYEHSPEFKEFVDNADENIKAGIKKMHTGYYMSRCQEPLVHLGTFGLSFVGKKLAEKKEFARLEETIKTDEFKTLFKNYYEIALRANLE